MIPTRNLRDSYKYYKTEDQNPVTIKLYLEIVLGFIKFIMKRIFEGCDVKLGPGDSLGTIGVRGKKFNPVTKESGEIRGIAPSWPQTKKLWDSNPEAKEKRELVYCFNEHSNGITYRFVWYKRDMRIHNKTYYRIAFSRANKRALSNFVKEGREYLTIS